MKANFFLGSMVAALALTVAAPAGVAATYNCPQPQQINCVPAVKTIAGWRDNGGQMTGNSFTPNNQCGNVVRLSANRQRLLCCYQKCGVFYRDVKAKTCNKVSESQFNCE